MTYSPTDRLHRQFPFAKAVGDAKNWSDLTGIPVYFGAVMVGNFNPIDEFNSTSQYSVPEQVQIATFVCAELRKVGIPFAVNADAHYINRETGAIT